MAKIRYLMSLCLLAASCSALTVLAATDQGNDMARIVGRGDIHRTQPPGIEEKPWVALYQGNGRFGCAYGPWGLHLSPGKKPAYDLRGVTHFTHTRHWVRGKFNADYFVPVATISWSQDPQDIQSYEQHESFYDGTVTTAFATPTWQARVTSWFDPVHRDVAGIRIEAQGNLPPIIISPFRHLPKFQYDQTLDTSVESRIDGQTWYATLRFLNANTPMTVKTDATLKETDDGVHIQLKPGRNDILVAVGGELQTGPDESLAANLNWWHSRWEKSGWLDLPDDDAQKVWIRGVAYTLYSHNDDGINGSPPTGLVGNGWPFDFPFDSGCRQPLLLWTGQIDAARAWIEFYASKAEGLRKYTRRIWNLDGIMLPHVFPSGSAEDYHIPTLPNDNYAPIYSSGHMVRMADQTAVMVNDPKWTKRYVVPLIEGAAQFYLSMAKKQDDGLWHFTVKPSLGLDEEAPRDQPDYFCTLVSAESAFRRAIDYGLDTDGRMAKILKDGLAYKTLLSNDGLYYANAGHGARDLGRQKHPDQFAPLIHIPLGPEPADGVRRCYEKRYDITGGAKIPRFTGHTLGEIILADARMHNAEGWRKEWAAALVSKNVDPEWIQFYESSGSSLAFYVTTHGLFAQAILETIVSTWWGRLDLANCIPWPGEVRFGQIRTLLGVMVSGDLRDGKGQVRLKAWKPTTFQCRGQTLTLKNGEEKIITID